MKNLIKITVISSFLIITCLLISACGTEDFVQGHGQIDVTVTNSATGLPLEGVHIQVNKDSLTGTTVSNGDTNASGEYTFQETVGTDYYFRFTKDGYAPQDRGPVSPKLTETTSINVAMSPVVM